MSTLIQKLVEMLNSIKDDQVDTIFNELFDKKIIILNYIHSYLNNKNCDLKAIINIHKLYCYFEEEFNEQD